MAQDDDLITSRLHLLVGERTAQRGANAKDTKQIDCRLNSCDLFGAVVPDDVERHSLYQRKRLE